MIPNKPEGKSLTLFASRGEEFLVNEMQTELGKICLQMNLSNSAPDKTAEVSFSSGGLGSLDIKRIEAPGNNKPHPPRTTTKTGGGGGGGGGGAQEKEPSTIYLIRIHANTQYILVGTLTHSRIRSRIGEGDGDKGSP